MKKFIVFILAFFYLGTSVGATVHMHYCMDKLAGWSFWNSETKQCNKCGMHKSGNNGCCKDEHKQVKLENDQKAAEYYQMLQIVSVSVSPSFFELPSIYLASETEENPISHAPPRSSGVAAYIRNCVFLI